jgi:hypothetical protein
MEIETAHKFLIGLGWTFTGQTCGCGGGEKKRSYNKDNNKIIIKIRSLQYELNKQGFKPLSQIYTDL